VIGTAERPRHSELGCSWLPSIALLTESHVYMARPDFVKNSLRLLWTVPIESVTALRSTETNTTMVHIEFDKDEEDADGGGGEYPVTRRCVLMKTRPALQKLADDLGQSWKELYQVDLERVLV
jgi:hypothetical protein